MTKPAKLQSCPKCGAKVWMTFSGSRSHTHFMCKTVLRTLPTKHLYQTDQCKLRVARAQLRKERARWRALEGVPILGMPSGCSVRQLADKLIQEASL